MLEITPESHYQPLIERAVNFQHNLEIPFQDVNIPIIKLIGIGGAGCKIINRIHHMKLRNVDTIAVNTDNYQLNSTNADKRVLIGKSLTKGLGAGGNPHLGKEAAEKARPTLETLLEKSDLCFVILGVGGGTGSGSAPVIAQIAKDQGAVVIGLAIYPLPFEKNRLEIAKEGINSLIKNTNFVFILDNKLVQNFSNVSSLKNMYSVIDQLISETIRGIIESISSPSFINLDFVGFLNFLKDDKIGFISFYEGPITEIEKISFGNFESKINSLSEENKNKGILIYNVGGDTTLGQLESITEKIRSNLKIGNDLIWVANVDKDLKEYFRVYLLFSSPLFTSLKDSENPLKLEKESYDISRFFK